MRSLALFAVIFLASLAVAQQATPSEQLPKLEHLSASQVNPQVDPCVDFYQYTCSKFFAANPIPPDQATWGVAGPLQKWNQIVLRQTLEAATAKKEGRSAIEQKIGDYWSSCMDEGKVQSAAQKEFPPELQRLNGLKNKSELADEIAHLHMTIPGAWDMQDPATFSALFGFSASQDYNDATKVLAQFDQGGMALPGREFYLKDDAKSVEIRKGYLAHVANMLKLAGE